MRTTPAVRRAMVATVLTLCVAVTACGSGRGGKSSSPSHDPSGAGQTMITASAPVGSVGAGASASETPTTGTAACQLFPSDNVWHARVDRLPTLAASGAYLVSIGVGGHLHPDFGSGLIDGRPFGIPITEVPAGQAGSRVTFDYSAESDAGPYPIPANVRIEGGASADGDRHVILHDAAACRLYELYAAQKGANGSWHAGSGAVFDLRSNALRPAKWTSADAAGLPIMAGLVGYDEVVAGQINHAIRVTVPRSANSYLWPARHAAGSAGASLPPMGLRLRMRAAVDTARLGPQARVIAQALKTYGMIVADNGSAWYISGTEDSRWNNSDLNALKSFTGADFEAVDASGLRITPDSGAAR